MSALLLAIAVLAPPSTQVDGPVREIHEQRIEIDGGTIRALCTDGARRVVLWHGERSSADVWRPVLERLDGSVGACAFDRRGSGGSLPDPGERGWYELLDELRRIHLALGFERDYVLVAHGLGGLYARVYAADRPTDPGALLLVDPDHEGMLEGTRLGMPRAEWERRMELRSAPNADGVVERAVGRRAARGVLPDVPMTVVTATVRPDGDGWDARFLSETANRLHRSILAGSHRGRHVPASCGHDVPLEDPGLVAAEIRRLLRLSHG